MGVRYFPAEDGPEDPPEDHAHSVHTCGWNGSLHRWRAEQRQPAPPQPETLADLQRVRAALADRAARRQGAGDDWRALDLQTRTLLVTLATDAGDVDAMARQPWASFSEADRAAIVRTLRLLRADLSAAPAERLRA